MAMSGGTVALIVGGVAAAGVGAVLLLRRSSGPTDPYSAMLGALSGPGAQRAIGEIGSGIGSGISSLSAGFGQGTATLSAGVGQAVGGLGTATGAVGEGVKSVLSTPGNIVGSVGRSVESTAKGLAAAPVAIVREIGGIAKDVLNPIAGIKKLKFW
jgi:hypothetical protein